MKRYIKSNYNPIEVNYTGGNVYLAEMDLGDGTYAVVSNTDYDELYIYAYPEIDPEDMEDEGFDIYDCKYDFEDMIYHAEVQDMDPSHKRIYRKLYKALRDEGAL